MLAFSAQRDNGANILSEWEENIANFLQNLAMLLKKSQFLSEVLQAVANNRGDLEMIFPLLEKNIDKLDGGLAEYYSVWEQI